MEVVMLPISEVKPYEKNPKRHPKSQIKKLAKSIESFGFHPPVELDTENVIIAGHGRYLAAKELGLEEIPCVVRDDLTETQARARRIADNKTAEGASWIDEFLQEEVQILRDEEMEIEAISDLIAFDREEVEALLGIESGDDKDGEGEEDDSGGVRTYKKDPNIIIRMSVHPGLWLGKREEIRKILLDMEKAYNCKISIEE